MTHRRATHSDCAMLAELNHQLIRDEGHRNPMSVAELEARMRDFLSRDYTAVIFEDADVVVAYALYREFAGEIYLRQLFVIRARRREGIGKRAVEILRSEYWDKTKRWTVEVLTANEAAVKFWRAMGYRDYCLALEILPDEKT
ncbi:MAG TPA: GNAT family N-acetyltransferase [Planctomycetota bacterium]|nr:GNAT family N-acetyltransferase [Planctomycetota bacterium]